MKEEILRAIEYYTKQLNSAQVVLDSGFGNNPNESNHLYVKRKEMTKLALTALQEQLDRLDGCGVCPKDEYFKITYLVEYQEGDGVFQDSKPSYCPKCGRKLRGGEDEK